MLGRAAAAAALVMLAGLAGPTLAVDPGDPTDPVEPSLEGVVFDASITVTFHESPELTGAPIAGASVQVSAARDGAPIADAFGLTDDLGTVTLDELPRAIVGTPVLLYVAADKVETWVDGPCWGEDSWSGSAVDVESAVDVMLELEAAPGSSEWCQPVLDDVIFDGSLTVDVVDGEGLAVTEIEVVAEAVLDGGEAIWQDVRPTNVDGRVTFNGLPRPEPGGPPVTWRAEAHPLGSDTVDGCWFFTWLDGSVEVAASESPVETILVVERGREPSGCEDPAPGSPLLAGIVVDEAGGPVPGSTFFGGLFGNGHVFITQDRADGGVWTSSASVAEDGTFSGPVHAWGSAGAPSTITLSAAGPLTRTEIDEQGCITQYALVGRQTIEAALADDPVLGPVEIVLVEGWVQTVCSETEVPGGTPTDGGGIELPPTDTDSGTAGGRDAGFGGAPAPPTLIAIVGMHGLLAALRRRSSPAS